MSDAMIGRAASGRASSSSASVTGEEPAEDCTSVLVEVGGDRGALVLYLDDHFRGGEVEISQVGSSQRVHTGVLDRPTAGGRVLAAVFGSLTAGRYSVWQDAGTVVATIDVTAGHVTEWSSDRQ